MITSQKMSIFKEKLIPLRFLKTSKLFLKVGCVLLSFGFQCSYSIGDDLITENGASALQVINGICQMYHIPTESINFSLKTDSVVTRVNASYSRVDGRRTLDFPNVFLYARGQYKYFQPTAQDQGIVSHESGHMVLDYLRPEWLESQSAHIGAFHEAFGDLTAHFYRFYNMSTQQAFLISLENGKGCVGDNSFTCVRNNSLKLTLTEVNQNHDLCEAHELSKTFSSAVYNNMREYIIGSNAKNVVSWHKRMLLSSALIDSPNPTLMDISLEMLKVSLDFPQYREGLGRNFIGNGLITIIYKSPQNAFYQPNQQFQQLCSSRPQNNRIAY